MWKMLVQSEDSKLVGFNMNSTIHSWDRIGNKSSQEVVLCQAELVVNFEDGSPLPARNTNDFSDQ